MLQKQRKSFYGKQVRSSSGKIIFSGFFYQALQLFVITLGFAVHTAAIRLAIYAPFLGKVDACLPVGAEIAVDEAVRQRPQMPLAPGGVCLWVLLFSGAGIGGGFIGEAQQVVGAGAVKRRQLDQHPGGDVPLADFIVGIAYLGAVEDLRQVLLPQVPVLPQVADSSIHSVRLPWLSVSQKV